MLEVLYDTTNNEVRGWCADPDQFDNFKPKEGQEVVILPVDVADIPESDDYWVDLTNKKLLGNPDYVPPETFNPKDEIDDLKARVKELEKK